MAAKNQKNLRSDLALITQIDEAEIDLPTGLSDFVENCLLNLTAGKLLNERERGKALALREYVQRQEND